MPWLERLNQHDSRRLARRLQRDALDTRDFARDRARRLARDTLDSGRREAADLAYRTGDTVTRLAEQAGQSGAQLARQAAQHVAHDAAEIAGEVARLGREEGLILAEATLRQATRLGRAMRKDPLPYIVGTIGLVLIANLALKRRH